MACALWLVGRAASQEGTIEQKEAIVRHPSNYLNDGALFNHGYIDKSTRFELSAPIAECDELVLNLCD